MLSKVTLCLGKCDKSLSRDIVSTYFDWIERGSCNGWSSLIEYEVKV